MKILVFDIDDTLTTSNSWERLNAAAGLTAEEDYALYSGFMRGDFDYDTWTKRLETLYRERGVLTREIANAALLKFELREGVVDTIKHYKDRGHTIMLLSGGFKIMAEAVGQLINADTVIALSDLAFDVNGQFDHFVSEGEEGQAKLKRLEAYCASHNILVTDCICVGDSMNDVPLFVASGQGVTFTWCKDVVKEKARYIIADIRDLPTIIS